jgi:hypothetical protein
MSITEGTTILEGKAPEGRTFNSREQKDRRHSPEGADQSMQ